MRPSNSNCQSLFSFPTTSSLDEKEPNKMFVICGWIDSTKLRLNFICHLAQMIICVTFQFWHQLQNTLVNSQSMAPDARTRMVTFRDGTDTEPTNYGGASVHHPSLSQSDPSC
mmetsp:Transcript_716/g.1525  ORF Transcript_716/g.1525 Transcript_716/m.1525 type:complete len:113 (+) Transcript_716:1015-1353(+)